MGLPHLWVFVGLSKLAGCTATQVQAPSPCIIDIDAHARERLAAELARQPEDDPRGETVESGTLDDLDGDGVAEPVRLLNPMRSDHSALHLIYLTGTGCTTLGAEVAASPEIGTYVDALSATVDGHRSLRAFSKGGCAGLEGVLHDYTWSASEARYIMGKRTRCGCPETETQARPEGCPT